jgi:prepilin-type N-terminal cleavage/methylation domain-containing protein
MRGFTLIEVMIVGVLIVAIATIAMPVSNRFQSSSQLNESTALLIEDLRLAGQDSFSGYQNTSYGVKFFADSYLVYAGDNYANRDVTRDRVINLLPTLRLSWLLMDREEIHFNRQGLPSVWGQIRLTHDNAEQKIIELNGLGSINQP